MISLIHGKIISHHGEEVTILTSGGVGYHVKASPTALAECRVGSDIQLDTYLVVREDALELFGFANIAEKELFKNFLTVSGVGPKTALHLLALGSVEETTLAIGRGDVEYLTKVSGIGKKTAERIVVDLKSKVAKGLKDSGVNIPAVNDAVSDVIDGLVTLGYSVLQARDAVKNLDPKGKTSEQLLREALRAVK
ncbi:MAG: Holliday junction branch migration protein RuvA [Candidatus Magasanikbacteria bacterium]|nr:Holliday junction branch migration protein RuvA [Candidatus Magasanikbacteria bacterium]